MKLVIDFEKLAYRKPKTSLDVLVNFFLDPLREVLGVTPDIPPFNYRYKGIKRFLRQVSYQELGKTICFDNEQANRTLSKHRLRLIVYNLLSISIHFSFLIFSALLVGVVLYNFYITAQSFNMAIPIFIVLTGFMTFGLSSVIALLSLRISSILVDRHFADTLALMSGIYLLVFLEKESSLSDPEVRRDIWERIRILRRNITLLSLTLSTANDPWPAIHFKQLENFVREREHWVIAPQAQTLDDLRRDFGSFVDMLVTGQYGDFTWDMSKVPQTITPAERKPAEKVIRFLAGSLPFVLLLILFLFPLQISAMGFDHNVVTLFLLGWLLLAIDSGLNLGLVERASGLAKTFKDLR